MKKIVEKTGKTEEEAINLALEELGKERDEVSVEIIERAKSGFLGLGGTPATVRITYECEDPKTNRLREFLSGLFERIGAIVEMDIKTDDQGAISVVLSGPKIGELIGRRGETLDAIQHLSNYAVNRGSANRVRINIDAENYRAKRSEALESLAKKIAAKVLKLRRDVTLEPMNAYERHVIHAALQEFPGVTTSSIGTEPNRRVVVTYDSNTAPMRPGMSREWH
jgi:spoIIIJ-associated protein